MGLFFSCNAPNINREDQIGSLPTDVISPSDNPSSRSKVELGRMLFWDPILSGNKDIACVTCHHPSHGYAENIDLSLGVGGSGLSTSRVGGALVKRNAPSILNTAFNGIRSNYDYDPAAAVMFWDNRTQSLEEQALGPLHSEEEMRGHAFSEEETLEVLSQRLAEIDEYRQMFTEAFGDQLINSLRIGKAIAAFERSLIAVNSRFDQFARGDTNVLTDFEMRGIQEFMDAGCTNCHNGPMLSDYELHNIGVKQNPKLDIVDQGVGGKFRTPSLRNLSFTAPYMHNGTVRTLKDAIRHYIDLSGSDIDPDLESMELDDDESTIEAIEAFLRTLDDPSFDKTIPISVPSGLNPGGNI